MSLGKLGVGCLRTYDATTMLPILTMRRPVGRPKDTKRRTGSINGLGRDKKQLCCVCFHGGGVDGGAWGAVAARGAAWRIGLIGADFGQAVACGRIHCGLVAHTRHPLARQGHGQLCGICFRGSGVDGGAWGAATARGAA